MGTFVHISSSRCAMLILRRKAGETLVIGDTIKVVVLDINEGSVRLAIEAPKEIPILRSELLQAADANRDAAQGSPYPEELLHLIGRRGENADAVFQRPKAAFRRRGAIHPKARGAAAPSGAYAPDGAAALSGTRAADGIPAPSGDSSG